MRFNKILPFAVILSFIPKLQQPCAGYFSIIKIKTKIDLNSVQLK